MLIQDSYARTWYQCGHTISRRIHSVYRWITFAFLSRNEETSLKISGTTRTAALLSWPPLCRSLLSARHLQEMKTSQTVTQTQACAGSRVSMHTYETCRRVTRLGGQVFLARPPAVYNERLNRMLHKSVRASFGTLKSWTLLNCS